MSAHAILGPGVSTPGALATAAAASRSRCRRANASSGVSPARMSDVARSSGVSAGNRDVDRPTATALVATIAGVGAETEAGATAGATAVVATSVDSLDLTLRRRTGLCPSSRLSHSRKASGEMSTPRPRNAIASTSTESPARRSRSSSSRCGSSCAVFGCFTWRAFATNSASVGGGVGAMSWWASGGEGVMWERYSERLRSAMGVGLDESKPKGLDVGVPAYCFIWILARSPDCSDTVNSEPSDVTGVSWSLTLDLSRWRSRVARSGHSWFRCGENRGRAIGGSRC